MSDKKNIRIRTEPSRQNNGAHFAYVCERRGQVKCTPPMFASGGGQLRSLCASASNLKFAPVAIVHDKTDKQMETSRTTKKKPRCVQTNTTRVPASRVCRTCVCSPVRAGHGTAVCSIIGALQPFWPCVSSYKLAPWPDH